MGRPKGSKNKIDETTDHGVVESEIVDVVETVEPKPEEVAKDPAKADVVVNPLGPGQQYFEAPTGELLIGEEGSTHFWWRAGNDGKGMWINPKR